MKRLFFSIAIPLLALLLCAAAGEGVLRLKNASMSNYDIEIWRYSKLFSVDSAEPSIGQEQRPMTQAILQNVEVRTNEWGGRGAPGLAPSRAERRILFLGGSITFGWGVAENETLTGRLQGGFDAAGRKTAVLNGGVVNYNAERYVGLFFERLKDLEPTDIVVHYFMRDIEPLPPPSRNRLLRESQLAFTAWLAATKLQARFAAGDRLQHYQRLYGADSPELLKTQQQFARLADYARQKNVRLYLAMMPDVHDLENYRFGFIHEKMQSIAQQLGFTYIDLLPSLRGMNPRELWSLPGDPHPNSVGHRRMADVVFPALNDTPALAKAP
jgi:lysophospholipase L1-like esterase